MAGTQPVDQLKSMHRTTAVVGGGDAHAVILVPPTDAGQEAGVVIADHVKAVSGVTLTVTADAELASLQF